MYGYQKYVETDFYSGYFIKLYDIHPFKDYNKSEHRCFRNHYKITITFDKAKEKNKIHASYNYISTKFNYISLVYTIAYNSRYAVTVFLRHWHSRTK